MHKIYQWYLCKYEKCNIIYCTYHTIPHYTVPYLSRTVLYHSFHRIAPHSTCTTCILPYCVLLICALSSYCGYHRNCHQIGASTYSKYASVLILNYMNIVTFILKLQMLKSVWVYVIKFGLFHFKRYLCKFAKKIG